MINRLLWSSLDWLFPPVCGGCKKAGYRWCPDCREQGQIVPEPVCQLCGLPIAHPGLCSNCLVSNPPYKIMRSWLLFTGPIRHALHEIKYRRNIALGEALADHLQEFVNSLCWPVELIIPVPLGKKRTKERGYNQVGLIALPLAEVNHWQYTPNALSRSRETRSQVGLTIDERKLNVLGAFKAKESLVSGKSILLVDDVATTGATLSACTSSLITAGAKSVYALTLARALPHQGLLNA